MTDNWVSINGEYKPRRNFFSRGHGGRYAYGYGDNVKSAVAGYKGCRSEKEFILLKGSPDLKKISCQVCGFKLSEASPNGDKGGENRMTYNPRTKIVYGSHYYCGWMSLMGQILDLGRAMRVG